MLSSRSWNPFKKEEPRGVVRRWQSKLRATIRDFDRETRELRLEEKKAQKLIKEAAARGDMASCKILAKEVVGVRRAIGRLAVNKANTLSLSSAMAQQVAMSRVAGSLEKSSEVMRLMNGMVKVPELMGTVREMSREMYKANIISEMVEDAMDSVTEAGPEADEEVDEAVQQVLAEIAGDTLAKMPSARRERVGTRVDQTAAAEPTEEVDELAAMRERLAAVKS